MSVALVALIAALSGSAVALPGKNGVDSADIKNGQVKSADLRNNGVRGADIRSNTIKGTDVNESSLGKVPSAVAADTATTANSAATAANASTANSATTAAVASNAHKLGDEPASAYVKGEQPGFSAPTLAAGFSNIGGGFAQAGYMKDTLGFVHLRGSMNCPMGTNVAFTLPAGFRPSASVYMPLGVGVGSAGQLIVTSSGDVQVYMSSANSCGLDVASFKAG